MLILHSEHLHSFNLCCLLCYFYLLPARLLPHFHCPIFTSCSQIFTSTRTLFSSRRRYCHKGRVLMKWVRLDCSIIAKPIRVIFFPSSLSRLLCQKPKEFIYEYGTTDFRGWRRTRKTERRIKMKRIKTFFLPFCINSRPKSSKRAKTFSCN